MLSGNCCEEGALSFEGVGAASNARRAKRPLAASLCARIAVAAAVITMIIDVTLYPLTAKVSARRVAMEVPDAGTKLSAFGRCVLEIPCRREELAIGTAKAVPVL